MVSDVQIMDKIAQSEPGLRVVQTNLTTNDLQKVYLTKNVETENVLAHNG